jgi:putative addiction module antidote
LQLEIKKIGNATGIILPKELLTRLGLKQGDQMFVTVEPHQTIKITREDPAHAEVMRLARQVMSEYRVTAGVARVKP